MLEMVPMAVCLVCGRYEEVGMRDALNIGWVFIKCPECQRGIPFDIIAHHLIKKTPEQFMEGFCPDHWFRDSGICSYCRMKRIALDMDAESKLEAQQQYSSQGVGWQNQAGGQDSLA